MKRVKSTKQFGVRQSLFIAGMLISSVGAQAAALPTVTIKGVIGNGLDNGSTTYDTSSWWNKTYTLELTADASNTVRTHTEISDIPGEYENDWRPINVNYRLTISGVPEFSGTDNQFSSFETLNDVTVPAGLADIPPEIVVGNTYDLVSIGGSNIGLGCASGGANNVCGDVGDVYEGFGFLFDYLWDVARHDAIIDDNLPDLRSAAIDFTKGLGYVEFDFWHSTLQSNGQYTGQQVALLQASVTEVTIAPIPEAKTYAMMLAGLGLVGFAARRRKCLDAAGYAIK